MVSKKRLRSVCYCSIPQPNEKAAVKGILFCGSKPKLPAETEVSSSG